MSTLKSILDADACRQQTLALRHLLRHPLTLAADDPEVFACILRRREWLHTWLADHPGWKLVVDPGAGFARLFKVPARLCRTRGAHVAGRPVFDRRRYVLLCLTLAALDDGPAQTTLASLSKTVEEISASEEPAIARFDPASYAERRAFVEVLRYLTELGVLRLRDGDAERFAQSQEGDALYDVHDRLLSQLSSSPVPPAFAGEPSRLLEEHLPDTEEGVRQRSRFHVFRRLLEDPVVYYDELDPQAFDWLDHSRGFLYAVLERDVGLCVERRKEGLAAIDGAGELTDTRFPDGGSTVKHAALLLAEQLAQRARHGVEIAGTEEVVALIAALQVDFGEPCRWSKEYGADGGEQLAAEALELLEGFGLVMRAQDGVRIRPAIARFRPTAPVAATGKKSLRALKSIQAQETP
jgi:uncharacterized protein (TIGR02678 family)